MGMAMAVPIFHVAEIEADVSRRPGDCTINQEREVP